MTGMRVFWLLGLSKTVSYRPSEVPVYCLKDSSVVGVIEVEKNLELVSAEGGGRNDPSLREEATLLE